MALIQCPECDKQVSTSAVSCPNCGAPVAAAAEGKAAGAPLTTTQLTSKKLKGQKIIAVTMFIVGAVWMSVYMGDNAAEPGSGMGWALLTLLVGLIWYVVIRFRTWWHHG